MQQSPVDLYPYFLTVDDLGAFFDSAGHLDWETFFGNSNPVEIYVGCGRGMFLVNAGAARPRINFLGIELDFKEGRHGAKRLKKRELQNVRILGGDVRVAFERHIRPASVSAVHVYFPDPWWKRKHLSRRIFTDQLVDQFTRILKPGGLVHSWTDVEDYFEVISALMNHHRQFESIPPPTEQRAEHDLDYQTSFERKKRQAGCTVHRGLWRLKSDD